MLFILTKSEMHVDFFLAQISIKSHGLLLHHLQWALLISLSHKWLIWARAKKIWVEKNLQNQIYYQGQEPKSSHVERNEWTESYRNRGLFLSGNICSSRLQDSGWSQEAWPPWPLFPLSWPMAWEEWQPRGRALQSIKKLTWIEPLQLG